ncbi:MAG TPA: indolepyruvate ferredoxin oxidoreductase family protein [Steroidobacteraceae bacterium]|nr:indolepyruvate ferredoxin oxidoreductase family protein [Steroidobacteraceae bacterium]
MALATDITLDDKYDRERGRVLLSGTQALVRLPLAQRARDAAAGLNTAAYISGYRGSPLGGYDLQLNAAAARLAAAHVRFVPGVNEDLAATAIWGTQQVGLLPGARYDGVFAIWYGKGPGVDRSGDPIKHGNRMGTAPHGGVLLLFGDDHPGKSSTISHQSEQALAANGVPVLYPATVQEFLDFGLHGFALSRYSGLWVGFKCVNETVEATATVEVDPARIECRVPAGEAPPGGVHARFGFDPLGDEVRLVRHKLPRAQAYARANGLDRVSHGAPRPGGLGLVAAGKSWLDAVAALDALGLDAARLAALGVCLYKPGLIWPLDADGLAGFARGLGELLVVEEKAAFLETQAAHALYNLPHAERPRLSGKRDAAGAALLPADVVLEPPTIARAIGARLVALGLADAALRTRLATLEARLADAEARAAAPGQRTPYFCAGCPHNSSTKVPEGSIAFAGIGCHTMAIYMNRATLPPTQMGGEGMTWVGMAPFTDRPHAFQNLGDGTYFHSGLLAIRAAVAAGANVTYKLLYNDAVAMTGGQAVEGHLSVAEITHQLRAERVGRIAVVSDEPAKYGGAPGFAAGVTVHERTELDALQRTLRQVPGVSAIVYDQVCAAEKRRRRKRGRLADPERRVLINPLVCEGCGDCSVQSNCVAVEPLETEFGRKRAIDQSSCNKDYSCIRGFCPAFVTVEGAPLAKPAPAALGAEALGPLPEPVAAGAERTVSVLVTGIGGTGVVTVGAVLAMAAHLEGRSASVYDMTGLAQKGGAVLSHVKIAPAGAPPAAPRVGPYEADVVLGCDLVVTASPEVLRALDPGRTRLALNTHLVPTAAFQLDPDVDFRARELGARIAAAAGEAAVALVDATGAARRLLGDSVGANLFVVGFALQRGWLPLGRAALERAIELNGAAVALNRRALELGRLAAADPARLAALLASRDPARAAPAGTPLEVRERFLASYQGARYAARYRALIERVAAAEAARTPGRGELAAAVTRGYFKLLAYKDEYEVARLHAGAEFRELVAGTFERGYRLRFHLAPPGIARPDPQTGEPRKLSFGGWLLPVFGLLARLRFLRGTPFDPFGYRAERRLERRLIADYEQLVAELLASLTPERHALAVELASLPEQIRGYGHVKARHLAALEQRRATLLERLRGAGEAVARAA